MFPTILTTYDHACFEAFSNKNEELEKNIMNFEEKITSPKFSTHIYTFKTEGQYLTPSN